MVGRIIFGELGSPVAHIVEIDLLAVQPVQHGVLEQELPEQCKQEHAEQRQRHQQM